jgi:hypothetical protein
MGDFEICLIPRLKLLYKSLYYMILAKTQEYFKSIFVFNNNSSIRDSYSLCAAPEVFVLMSQMLNRSIELWMVIDDKVLNNITIKAHISLLLSKELIKKL